MEINALRDRRAHRREVVLITICVHWVCDGDEVGKEQEDQHTARKKSRKERKKKVTLQATAIRGGDRRRSRALSISTGQTVDDT